MKASISFAFPLFILLFLAGCGPSEKTVPSKGKPADAKPSEQGPSQPVPAEGSKPRASEEARAPLPAGAKAVEDYGAVGDYTGADFYNNLTIIPLRGEGEGASHVVYTGLRAAPFDAAWVGRELVVFRSHHNPGAYPDKRNYFPNLKTCRYVKVTKVVNPKTIEVDLSINGGNSDFKPDGKTPSLTDASGYFFTNNREAFKKAFTDPDRPKAIVLENGKTYVVRGGWNCSVPKDLMVTTRDPKGPKAAIKISMEDAFSLSPHGDSPDECASFKAEYDSGNFFNLRENEDFSISLQNIDLLPPHYSVPVTQYGYGLGCFFVDGVGRLSRRTLAIYDSNCFREADDPFVKKLPSGTTFILPGFAFSNGGGRAGEVDFGGALGKRQDVTGFQEFKLIRSHWQCAEIHNIKQQGPAAGNCFIAEGESPEKPARMFPSTEIILKGEDGPGQFRLPVTITDDRGDGAFRRVNLHTESFSWYQLANQYWVGGGLTSTFPIYLEATDPSDAKKACRVYFGTARELAVEEGFKRDELSKWFATVIQDGFTIRIAERIPKTGNVIKVSPKGGGMNIKLNDTTFRVFGWGLQEGDRLEYGGKTYSVKSVARRHDWGQSDAPDKYGPGYGGPVNYDYLMCLDVTLDAPVAEATPSFRVASSKLEYLLNGKHTMKIVNTRLIGDYFCYSDNNLNVRMKNCRINGRFRATSTYNDNPQLKDTENLARQTQFMEFVNVIFEGKEMPNELAGNRSLVDRSRITGKPHRVIIDGSRLFWTWGNVELRNCPTLIYGTASAGEPRLINPVTDGKGLRVEGGLSVQLQGGFTCDLSNTTILENSPEPWIAACGEGTLVVDNLRVEKGQGGITLSRANGFDPKIPNRIAVKGSGGEGGLRVQEDFGANSSVTLEKWKLLNVFVGGEWQGVKGGFARGEIPAAKISVNGQSPP